MADGEKRIVELTETQTFGNGDYLPLDNISNSETKKIEAKKLGITYTMTDTEDGFSFDGSNGYHYEKVIPKDAQMSYDDYDDLTEEEKMDGSNRFIPDYPDEVKEPEIWTRVGRTPLETDAKTISPAINELKGRIDDSDTEIEEVKNDLIELTDITQWNHQSVSIAPSSLDAWVDDTVSGLSDAKRCILTVYESNASNAAKVGAYEFINVIGYGIITLIFTYNDSNTNNIYKSSTHVRVDFDNNKVGVRMVAKGTSATYRCIKDVYWI